MSIQIKPIAFVLGSTDHGTLILNRNDYAVINDMCRYGVGNSLLQDSSYEADEVEFLLGLLKLQRKRNGDGVVFLDCGANIGVMTVEAARMMTPWGEVHAFEPQDFIFYALAGNIAINNLFNARAYQLALGAIDQVIKIPKVDYCAPGSYGSLELIEPKDRYLSVGQELDYSEAEGRSVRQITIDSLDLRRVDLIKIDVESMEMNVLRGSGAVIEKFKPIIWVEVLKSDESEIKTFLKAFGYSFVTLGKNIMAFPDDKTIAAAIEFRDNVCILNV